MIYEAEAGQTIADAAKQAIVNGCDKFLHNGKIFKVEYRWSPLAVVEPAKTLEGGF